jgi:hypothetical protein
MGECTECPDCNGTGNVHSTESIPCSACAQTGKLIGASCVCCNGTGIQLVEVRTVCLICGDKGQIGRYVRA